jgi:hypothetical protein
MRQKAALHGSCRLMAIGSLAPLTPEKVALFGYLTPPNYKGRHVRFAGYLSRWNGYVNRMHRQ